MSDPYAQFEARLQAAMQPGAMDAAFAARLRGQLAAAARRPQPARRPRLSRRAWASLLVVLALAAALLAIGPQRVLARVLGLFGYVPGVGFVYSETGLRILSAPQTQEREGIRVTVLDGLVDDSYTTLTIRFEGVRQEQKPTSEDIVGCYQQPILRLPDGSQLALQGGGGGGGPSWQQVQLSYPALPANVNEVVVEVPCIPEVLPGLGPENWQIPLRFVPAPDGFEVLPVQALEESTEPAPDPHGIRLAVNDYVELEDGYLLRGRFSWAESSLSQPEFSLPEFMLLDAQGRQIPVEMDEYPDLAPQNGFTYFAWTLRTNTKQISSPVQLVVPDLSLRMFSEFDEANSVAVDLGLQPQDGHVWRLQQDLPMGDLAATLNEARFEGPRLDGTYAIWLDVTFDSQAIASLNISDANNLSQMLAGSGAGGAAGQIELGIIYDYLPTGVHHFWVDNYFMRLIGPWQASITLPPASGDPSPPEACLLPQDWPALQTASAPLDGRLLLEGPPPHGVYFPGLSLMDLADGQRQELSPGGWADLSPSGEQVAYINDIGLHVLQANSGEDSLIVSDAYSPVWAPTGDRLAFVRSGQGIWLSNSLGGEMTPLPGTNTDTTGIVGWSPDGSQLAVFSITPLGSQIHQIDVETGAAQELLVIANRKAAFAQLSPDGRRIAYSAEVFGSLENGLYVSNLDGSQSNLIAQSGPDVLFTLGAWSPDGRWLLLNARDPRQLTPALQAPVIVNVETCQAAVLPSVLGDVLNWSATP